MLKQRVLTALVLLPLVILAVFFLKQPYFALLISGVVLLMAWEWARLAGWKTPRKRILYILLIFFTLPFALLFPVVTLIIGAIWWACVMYWILRVRNKENIYRFPAWVIAAFGLCTLLPCWSALQILSHDRVLLFYLLIVIWLADTGAYFGGRLFGRAKLAPAISPNKTAEGFACAVTCVFLFAALSDWYWFTPHQLQWNWLLPALATVMAAVIGDLFESLLKRQQGLKDSGHLLPGHGGILDRLDSLLAAAPVFTCSLLGFHLLG